MKQPSLFDALSNSPPVPAGYRIDGTASTVGDGTATGQYVVEWNGVCACGKSERDGIRCKLGATHAARG